MTMTYADKEWNVIKAKSVCGKLDETALSGTVYRHGNHGDYWEEVGTLKGWA